MTTFDANPGLFNRFVKSPHSNVLGSAKRQRGGLVELSKQPIGDELTSLFEAMAHPTRRDILVRLLNHEQMTVGQLSDQYPVSQPAITGHLKKLQSAGLVSRHSEGQTRVITLQLKRFSQVADWIQPFLERREAIQDLIEVARRGSRGRARAKGKSKKT